MKEKTTEETTKVVYCASPHSVLAEINPPDFAIQQLKLHLPFTSLDGPTVKLIKSLEFQAATMYYVISMVSNSAEKDIYTKWPEKIYEELFSTELIAFSSPDTDGL